MVTSPDVTTPTTTMAPPCEDQLKGDNACQNLEMTFTSLCQDPNGRRTCARYCGVCKDPPTTTTSTTTTTTTTAATTTTLQTTLPSFCSDLAEDAVCQLPGFCDDRYAHALCQRTCGFCIDACQDILNCPQLLGANGPYSTTAELCQEPDRAALCRETCGGCP